MGSGVVTRNRCVGAWSIPGAMGSAKCYYHGCKNPPAPQSLSLCLLRDLGLTLPISPRQMGARVEVPSAVPGPSESEGL